MKKIVIILTTILVIVLSIIPTISAAVIPTNDWTPIYSIKMYSTEVNGDIPIYSLTYDEVAQLPDGFEVYGYRNQYVQGDINHVITLRDGSRFVYTSNGSTFNLLYRCVYQSGYNNGVNNDFTIISNASISLDFVFVVTSQGYIGYTLFNKDTGNVFTTNITTVPLYTNVDDYYAESDYDKGYDEGYKEGYKEGDKVGSDRGYSQGLREGKQIGYDEGVEDGYQIYAEEYDIENIVTTVWDDAYSKGYDEGKADGVKQNSDAVYNYAYNKGLEDGELVGNAINGFYDGLVGFFRPFLSLGFGDLTLFSLLSVIVIVSATILIIKLLRG